MSEKAEQRSASQFPVPNGFRNLLEALAREVLRSQPTDIYEFSSLYLQHLVKYRNEYHTNPIDDKDLYDHFKTAFFKEACSLNLVQSAMLNSIFSGKNLPSKTGGGGDDLPPKDNASGGPGEEKVMHISKLTDPAALKNAEARKSPQRPASSHSGSDHSPSSHSPASPDEAAVLIQAGVRGFLTRKHLEEEGMHLPRPRSPNMTTSKNGDTAAFEAHQVSPEEEHSNEQYDEKASDNKHHRNRGGSKNREQAVPASKHLDESPDEAAAIIQANVRGFLTRKHLEAEGIEFPNVATLGGAQHKM